ncbi:MAG: hypothetical protein Tsb006_5880 [Rickettsiaceae bacterium]
MKTKKQDIAIIGAGISGLSLANMLIGLANVRVFEKSRGFGGRIATRYSENFEFDHGAQFFTIKTDKFKKFMQPLLDKGVVDVWKAKFVEINANNITHKTEWNSNYPHYVGVPRMNMVCKHLAHSLDITLETEVKRIERLGEYKWQLFNSNNDVLGKFDWVISSIPSFQAHKLLPSEFAYHDYLKSVKMLGCYSLMLGFENRLDIEWDAALVKNSNISWISHNSSKPGRKTLNSIVALTSNKWAEENMEASIDSVKADMLETLLHIIKYKKDNLIRCEIHRWRYANVGKNTKYKYLLNQNNKLAAIGDWCISGRIESGFLSANALYSKLTNII